MVNEIRVKFGEVKEAVKAGLDTPITWRSSLKSAGMVLGFYAALALIALIWYKISVWKEAREAKKAGKAAGKYIEPTTEDDLDFLK